MKPVARLSAAILALCFSTGVSFGQTEPPRQAAGPHQDLHLNVVVTGKNGVPTAGLAQNAFTLLDNKAPRPIRSFRALGPEAPVEVVVILDAVNTPFTTVSYERNELGKFLASHNGRLARPVRLALLTDKGLEAAQTASRDGAELGKQLDQLDIGLRTIRRSTGFYGAEERLDISLRAMQTLLAAESRFNERKLIVWISPGWPLLSGPAVDLSSKDQARLFPQVVGLSAELQLTSTTLYAVDPRGTGASLESSIYYEQFVKGVSKPSQAYDADLSLQVLAEQSGGLVLNGSNDIRNLLQRCVDDANAYYELTFSPAPAEKPNEYHALEVHVNTPGLVARTQHGYYAQP